MNQKFCPNCGHMQPREAEVCSNCGYQFKKIDQGEADHSQTTSQNQKRLSRVRPHYGYLMLGAILIAIILIGGATVIEQHHYHANQTTAVSSSKRVESKKTSSKTPTKKESAKKSKKPATKVDPNSSNLKTNLDPKQNVAAISYYAAKKASWKDLIDPNVGLTVRTSTGIQLLNRLTAKGQSMTYEVIKGQNAAADAQTNYVYTIDDNGNINIYNLPADKNATNIAPVKTISRDDITKYINAHHQANDVRTLSSKVTVVNANN